MFNDSYLPGCLMAAYGLERQEARSPRICVVTPDISQQARSALASLYDRVIEVPEISAPPPAGGRADAPPQPRTGSARVTGAALTRFASLRLGTDGDLGCAFEKVVVIDADLLPLRDYGDLWALPAPAGIVNEHRTNMVELDAEGRLVVRPEYLATGQWNWHHIYGSVCPHGARIPREITDRVRSDFDNYGVNASVVLLEPSVATYEDFMRWVTAPDISELVGRWPWTDQQAATLYWSGRWTNIDVSYSTLYGYPSLDLARGLHFAGVKPWSWRKKGFAHRLQRFPDYGLWATVYLEMLEAVPEIRRYASLRRLEDEIRSALGQQPARGQRARAAVTR